MRFSPLIWPSLAAFLFFSGAAATPLAVYVGSDHARPCAQAPLRLGQASLVVTVDAQGRYYLGAVVDDASTPLLGSILEARVAAILRHRPALGVVLRAADHVSPDDLVALRALLRRAGASDVPSIAESPQALLHLAHLQHLAQLQRSIGGHWVSPSGAPSGLSTRLRVLQTPRGGVTEVVILTSSGNDVFDQAAEIAVHRSSPLPVPKYPCLFESRWTLTLRK